MSHSNGQNLSYRDSQADLFLKRLNEGEKKLTQASYLCDDYIKANPVSFDL